MALCFVDSNKIGIEQASKQADVIMIMVEGCAPRTAAASVRGAKSDFEKTLQDIFLEQIEKQRTMFQDNVTLTPKINIKFYAVNPQTLKAKASVVADSVVDALEKRKAFRKAVKDAKEELM